MAKFWTKLINNKKYNQEELTIVRQQISSIGQELVYQIMYGLFHTQRSDLNSYTDLLRALVAKFPIEAREWLVAVLPQICSNPAGHEKFINKLLITRGSRAAGNVILQWWLDCTTLPNYQSWFVKVLFSESKYCFCYIIFSSYLTFLVLLIDKCFFFVNK